MLRTSRTCSSPNGVQGPHQSLGSNRENAAPKASTKHRARRCQLTGAAGLQPNWRQSTDHSFSTSRMSPHGARSVVPSRGLAQIVACAKTDAPGSRRWSRDRRSATRTDLTDRRKWISLRPAPKAQSRRRPFGFCAAAEGGAPCASVGPSLGRLGGSLRAALSEVSPSSTHPKRTERLLQKTASRNQRPGSRRVNSAVLGAETPRGRARQLQSAKRRFAVEVGHG